MTLALLAWPDGWPEPAALLAAAAALLALATLVVVLLALRARRPAPGLREVRRAVEDLTEGRYELDLEFPDRLGTLLAESGVAPRNVMLEVS